MGEQPALNTDRELFREDTGDRAGSYYENSLHVTAQGTIGMNVGGTVYTLPIARWHALAAASLGVVDDYDYTAADIQARRPDQPGHRAVPGPDYWSWRCLQCDGEVRDHPSLWQRLRTRMRPGQTP